MKRFTFAALAALAVALAFGTPVRAMGLFSGHQKYGYSQPMVPMTPVSPFGVQQVVQGLQLLHVLVDGGQGQQQNREPAPQPKVSQDVVDTLKRIDDALDPIVANTNTLTKAVRDPLLIKDNPKFRDAVQVGKPKTTTTGGGDSGKLKLPGD
jgi:hypothetical protein